MAEFGKPDIEALETKLLSLDLTDGESAALDALVAVAEQATSEVSGFGSLEGLKPGSLGFLSGLHNPSRTVRDGPFASAGGLGTTRTKDEFSEGTQGHDR